MLFIVNDFQAKVTVTIKKIVYSCDNLSAIYC